ncbi:MAG: hypothetical protein AB8G05_04870 [Oligoflexales bacterium]
MLIHLKKIICSSMIIFLSPSSSYAQITGPCYHYYEQQENQLNRVGIGASTSLFNPLNIRLFTGTSLTTLKALKNSKRNKNMMRLIWSAHKGNYMDEQFVKYLNKVNEIKQFNSQVHIYPYEFAQKVIRLDASGDLCTNQSNGKKKSFSSSELAEIINYF